MAQTAAQIRKVRKRMEVPQGVMAWIFNTPYVVYSIVFLLIPLVWAAWLSLTDWNLMSKDYNMVGLANYARILSDAKVQSAFWNAYRYMVPLVVLCFVFGLLIALRVSKLPEKIKGVVAVLFFVPYLTSGVATSVMVKYVFSYNSALNVWLRTQFQVNINWLSSEYAFWILCAMIVWKMSGYYALFILSGIESISPDVNEAAMLDGCTGFQKLWRVTLPIITPTLTNVVVLATGLSFQIFTEPFLLTGGGPMSQTTTWQLEIYNTSFVRFQSGYGATMAIVNAVQIFITIQLITMAMNKINRKFGA